MNAFMISCCWDSGRGKTIRFWDHGECFWFSDRQRGRFQRDTGVEVKIESVKVDDSEFVEKPAGTCLSKGENSSSRKSDDILYQKAEDKDAPASDAEAT